MDDAVSTLDRAFALARDGVCRSVNEIRQRLRGEGRADIQTSLYGGDVNRQLVALMQAAALKPA